MQKLNKFMSTLIKVHGRQSFRANISFLDSSGSAADLSEKSIFFETSAGRFRKNVEPFVPGEDVTVRSLYLKREDVDSLSTAVSGFVFLDETVPGSESVLGEGTIQRVGWVK